MFPVQVLPVVGTAVPYLTHAIGFGLLLYLAIQGLFSAAWLLIPWQFSRCSFCLPWGWWLYYPPWCVLRDLQVVLLSVTIWFSSRRLSIPSR